MPPTLATAASVHVNDSMFDVVDVTQIKFSDEKGFSVYANDTKRTFSITSPPLLATFPEDTFEGNLGKPFMQGKKDLTAYSRDKAKFKITVAMGSDEETRRLRPQMMEQQRLFFQRVYETGRRLLTSVYKAEPTDYIKFINEAKNAVLVYEVKLELDAAQRSKTEPAYKDVQSLVAVMAKNEPLRTRIEAAQLESFLQTKHMFANPDDYDEEGVKKRTYLDAPGAKLKTMSLELKRAVWKFDGKFVKGMKLGAPDSITLAPASPATWSAVLASMTAKKCVWNCFKYTNYFDGSELPRPMYTPPGTSVAIPDPSWSPLTKRTTLVEIECMFAPWAAEDGYGVKAIPFPVIRKIREIRDSFSSRQSTSNMDLALNCSSSSAPRALMPPPSLPAIEAAPDASDKRVRDDDEAILASMLD